MSKKFDFVLVLFLLALALTGIALAIPQTFNIIDNSESVTELSKGQFLERLERIVHNGKLTDISNTPLSGTYTFNFSIYSAASGGTHLWTSNAMSVTTDSNGIYKNGKSKSL